LVGWFFGAQAAAASGNGSGYVRFYRYFVCPATFAGAWIAVVAGLFEVLQLSYVDPLTAADSKSRVDVPILIAQSAECSLSSTDHVDCAVTFTAFNGDVLLGGLRGMSITREEDKEAAGGKASLLANQFDLVYPPRSGGYIKFQKEMAAPIVLRLDKGRSCAALEPLWRPSKDKKSELPKERLAFTFTWDTFFGLSGEKDVVLVRVPNQLDSDEDVSEREPGRTISQLQQLCSGQSTASPSHS
jgi:hypothetical protein